MKTKDALLGEINLLINRGLECELGEAVFQLGELFKGINIRGVLGPDVENQIRFHKGVIEGAEAARELAEAQAKALAEAAHHPEAVEAPVLAAAGALAAAAPAVVRETPQMELESIGLVIAEEVAKHLQGLGCGTRILDMYVKLFCKKVNKVHAEAVRNDEVVPPKSLEVLMGLYHLDYNDDASIVLPKLCVALQGGLPHIDDHF